MDDIDENKDGLPIAAEHPDAAPKPHDHPIRIGIHVVVLLAVAGLLIYCCAWMPFRAGGY